MISRPTLVTHAGWIVLLVFAIVLEARPPRGGAMEKFERIERTNLWNIAEWQDSIPWQPFRPGVEIHRLYGDGKSGPTAALLRYREAATVPVHTHQGFEHILVLSGSQRDQNGVLQAGTLSIHPPGTRHSVVSEAGCIVLAIYEKPVKFESSNP
ncbi:MAG: cupin domain-containing protein [Verrucomicrobiales bacterium]|nr:cupin domain-containing protein [Verrucomicrobiales bacterium]